MSEVSYRIFFRHPYLPMSRPYNPTSSFIPSLVHPEKFGVGPHDWKNILIRFGNSLGFRISDHIPKSLVVYKGNRKTFRVRPTSHPLRTPVSVSPKTASLTVRRRWYVNSLLSSNLRSHHCLCLFYLCHQVCFLLLKWCSLNRHYS